MKVRRVRALSCGGIVPLNEFPLICRNCRFVRPDMVAGSVPVRPNEIKRLVRPVSWPTWEPRGFAMTRVPFPRNISVTTLAVQTTPSHGLLLSQGSWEDQSRYVGDPKALKMSRRADMSSASAASVWGGGSKLAKFDEKQNEISLMYR